MHSSSSSFHNNSVDSKTVLKLIPMTLSSFLSWVEYTMCIQIHKLYKIKVQRSGESRGHSLCSPIMNAADWMKSSSALHSTSHSPVKPVPCPQQTHTSSPLNNGVTHEGQRDTRSAPPRVLAMGISCFKQERWGVFLQPIV